MRILFMRLKKVIFVNNSSLGLPILAYFAWDMHCWAGAEQTMLLSGTLDDV